LSTGQRVVDAEARFRCMARLGEFNAFSEATEGNTVIG
jgi:hypothetical protein